MSDENSQLILQRLDRIDMDIRETNSKINELSKELSQTQKWQDRTWDVVKWVGGISAGLSISAAIALVGLVIRLAR